MKNSNESDKPKPKRSKRKKHEVDMRRPEHLDPAVPLTDVLKRLKITDWDFIIFGDGSGQSWQKDCGAGWGSISIEKSMVPGGSHLRDVWTGQMNKGTVNIAEMMAYLQPLEWLASREEDKRQNGGTFRAFNIHLVTDSQYCRDTGEHPKQIRKRNEGLWALFDAFKRRGFVLHWHWIRRESVGLNWYADMLSKLARRSGQKYNLLQTVEEFTDETVYDVNPDGDDE